MFGYLRSTIRDQCHRFGNRDRGASGVVRERVEVIEADTIEWLNE